MRLATRVAILHGIVAQTSTWARDLPEDDFLVEWCRTAPNLVSLDASSCICINMERAAAIGSACPLLEDVKFSGWDGVSPAESWAKVLPQTAPGASKSG